MDALERLIKYIRERKKVPFHYKADLKTLWKEEGKSSVEFCLNQINWNQEFEKSDLDQPSRSDIRCWVEQVASAKFFNNIGRYCNSMYFNPFIFTQVVAWPELLKEQPELSNDLQQLLENELYPALSDGVYERISEQQKSIMSGITGS